jgi:hypothetical protein
VCHRQAKRVADWGSVFGALSAILRRAFRVAESGLP